MRVSLVIPLILLIVFLSTALRSAFGFGNALIAMPLLVMLGGVKAASALVALLGVAIALVMLFRDWRKMELKDLVNLLLASLAGIPLGLSLLVYLPETLIKGILGSVLIGFGSFRLLRIQLPIVKGSWLAIPIGFLAGILGGAYNANGPPIVIYGLLKGWDQGKFKATLQGYFLVTGLLVAASHGLAGLWNGWVIIHFAVSVPLVILGVLAGERITATISADRYQQALSVLLILLGILMFV